MKGFSRTATGKGKTKGNTIPAPLFLIVFGCKNTVLYLLPTITKTNNLLKIKMVSAWGIGGVIFMAALLWVPSVVDTYGKETAT